MGDDGDKPLAMDIEGRTDWRTEFARWSFRQGPIFVVLLLILGVVGYGAFKAFPTVLDFIQANSQRYSDAAATTQKFIQAAEAERAKDREQHAKTMVELGTAAALMVEDHKQHAELDRSIRESTSALVALTKQIENHVRQSSVGPTKRVAKEDGH